MKIPVVLILVAVLITGLSLLTIEQRSRAPVSSASNQGVDMSSEIASLMQTDSDFDRDTAAKGVEGWVSYFAEDGAMFRGGGKIIAGHDAIRALMTPFFADKNSSLRWQPVMATVASSGELGYTYGNWTLKTVGDDGKPVVLYGKYVTIWKKQADGAWKAAVDLGTTGAPTPPDDAK
ncbi:DUF4440 domain-containing protein [Candidatus Acetothermia bacterium]|nr:DUF4440 domain-containing protein [Candidatus Acetothermia bacterium]MBI3643462.1 DUF4440 domain-containing protein [Candidatus Acetothermia bacterium]